MSQNDSLDTLIELHLDGQLSAEQADRLASLLKDSDEASARFWHAVHLHHATVELADRHWGQISATEDGSEGKEPLSIESTFPATTTLDAQSETGDAPVGLKEVCTILGYQLRQSARKHRAALATAAVLTIAGIVCIVCLVVLSGNEPASPLLTKDEGSDVVPVSPAIVATLTADHDAVWERRPGQDLYAGQRFTLNQGFAEITTASGAVAILEAPATIELLDNKNAIYLHNGKLVGICETQSSKGFLVRTPQIEVTDIGTKFGVTVKSDQTTEAHVFEGEVQVSSAPPNRHASTHRRFFAGQAVKYHEELGLESIDLDLDRFSLELDYDAFRPTFAGDSAQWLGQVPADLSSHAKESDALQVFIERAGVTLERDLAVELVLPQGPGQIAAGEAVDIYLLHLDPPSGSSAEGTYTVRFDRPILGVAYSGEGLGSTDPLMAGLSIQYPTDIPLTQNNYNPRGTDLVIPKLINDGTALQVSIDARGALDQVRVLVRAKERDAEQ